MSARGPYAKGRAKREEILQAALDVIAEHGYDGATVKQIAAAVGMSHTALLHYFGSKDALFSAIMQRRDAEQLASYEARMPVPDVRAAIVAAIRDDVRLPGFIHLATRMTADAADRNHPLHDTFAQRLSGATTATAAAIEAAQHAGEFSTDVSAADAAVITRALVEGLQLLWLYDRSIDIAALMDSVLASLEIDERSD